MKRVISMILAVLALVSSLAFFAGCSCSDKAILDKIKSSKEDLKVVGNSGNSEILYEELRCITLGFKERMEWTYGDDIWDTEESRSEYKQQLEDYVMYALKVNAAAIKVCKDNGISIDDDDVKAYVELELNKLVSDLSQSLILQKGDDNYNPSRKEINEAYKKFLEQNHLTDNYYRYVLGVNGCVESLKQKFIENGTLSFEDDDVTDYIKENFARTIHVYIPFDSSTADEVKKNAELVEWIMSANLKFDSKQSELREKLGITDKTEASSSKIKFFERITNAEDDIEKMKILVGSIYNKDLMISQNGYYFSYGEFDEAYETATFALNVGETSKIVTTKTGYYIIQRLELDDNYIFTNLDTLKTQYQMSYINKLIDEEKEKTTFVFNDYGKSLDLINIK